MTKPTIRFVGPDGIVDKEVEGMFVSQEEQETQALLRARMDAQSASEAALADAELMQTWGELNFLWDEIETSLYIAFDSMVEADGFTTRAIFYSQKTHAGRRGMVEEVAKCFFKFRGKSITEDALMGAIKRVKARSDIRNTVTHGTWGWKSDGKAKTVEVVRFASEPQMDPNQRVLSKKDLVGETNAMRDTLVALRGAIKPLFEAKIVYFQRRIEENFERSRPLLWPPILP